MSVPRLRIAVDGTPLLGVATGVAQFCDGLLRGLVDADEVDLTAYALTWRGREGLADAVPAGVRPLRRPLPARPLREAWQRTGRPPIEWLLAGAGPFDVIHATNQVLPPRRRTPGLVSVHDLTPLHFPELCTADTRRYPALVGAAIAGGAWVHTISDHVAGEIVEHYGASPDRVVTVHPGVPDVAAAPPGAGRAAAGADRYVLALGTIEPRKDHPLLVAAFDDVAAQHPDVRLVVAGADGWGAEQLDAALGGLQHRDRIHRLGYVDAATRAALLRDATVLAYPSRYEGFGFPPLEAQTVGVPVVATDAGPLPEVLGDSARLVPAGDRARLAEALADVLDDGTGAAERLVAAGRTNVTRFGWDRCAREMTDLYRRVAGA